MASLSFYAMINSFLGALVDVNALLGLLIDVNGLFTRPTHIIIHLLTIVSELVSNRWASQLLRLWTVPLRRLGVGHCTSTISASVGPSVCKRNCYRNLEQETAKSHQLIPKLHFLGY